jgi:hypothetical protein
MLFLFKTFFAPWFLIYPSLKVLVSREFLEYLIRIETKEFYEVVSRKIKSFQIFDDVFKIDLI